MAVQFRDNGYKTSMFGKWHLSSIDYPNYTYDYAKSLVNKCGFDHVSGLYPKNLAKEFNNGSFSHNMEWVTAEAVKEIRKGIERRETHTPLVHHVLQPHRASQRFCRNGFVGIQLPRHSERPARIRAGSSWIDR